MRNTLCIQYEYWFAGYVGLKEAFKIYEDTLIYKKLGARIPPVPIEECGQLRYRSDEYLKCYIKYKSVAGWHPAGTCKMGSGQTDSTAVVDSKLRWYIF